MNFSGTRKGIGWQAIVVLFWVLALGLEIFFLTYDLDLYEVPLLRRLGWLGGQEASTPVIAELMTAHGEVRIQPTGELVWQSGFGGAPLRERQRVLTLQKSRADIAFLDGFGIEVGENSLVEISRVEPGNPGRLVVRLMGGSIRARGRASVDRKIEVQIEGTQSATLEASGGAVWEVSVQPNGDLKTDVSEGQVLIRHPELNGTLERGAQEWKAAPLWVPPAPPAPPPPPKKLQGPEFQKFKPRSWRGGTTRIALRLFWDGLVQVWAHAETARNPEDLTWSVKLKWEAVPAVSGYKIQVARTRSFSSLLSQADIQMPEYVWVYQVGMENSKGRVFYRIASVGADGQVGEFSQPEAILIPSEILAASKIQQEKKRVVMTDESVLPARMRAGSALHTGMGNFSQTSATAVLHAVHLTAPFVQQKLSLGLDWAHRASVFSFGVEGAVMGFTKPDLPRTTIQPDVLGWRLKTTAMRSARNAGQTLFGYGLTLDRSFRWIKSGPQSVEPAGAFSIGPALTLVTQYALEVRVLRPRQWGFLLELPASGWVTRDQVGVRGSVWAEWALFQIGKGDLGRTSWIGIRSALETEYFRWATPEQTGIFGWTAWLAPTFHWGDSTSILF